MSSVDMDYRRLPKSNNFSEDSFSTLLLNAEKGSTDIRISLDSLKKFLTFKCMKVYVLLELEENKKTWKQRWAKELSSTLA